MSFEYVTITSFPKDDVERIVWWYGAVYLENSNPLVKVALRRIDEYGDLSDADAEIISVAIPELCKVRLCSVWRGQTSTEHQWKNLEDHSFKFDLNKFPGESIDCFTKNPSTTDSKFGYIPPYKYSLNSLPREPYRQDMDFKKSKLTKLISTNNITVLIPSLELLSSIYTPEEMDIRRRLLTKSVDELLDIYLDLDKCSIQHDGYHVFMKKQKNDSNTRFLAYLALNPVTKSKVSKLYADLAIQGKNTQFKQRYPSVLPWQPDELSMNVKGIWLDNSRTTFLVLQITAYSEPAGINIFSTSYESHSEGKPDENKETVYVSSQTLVRADLPITRQNEPSRNAGVAYLRSEVQVLGLSPEIHRKTITRNSTNNAQREFLEPEEASTLASGEIYGGRESATTAKLKQYEKIDLDKTEKEVEPSHIIYDVAQGIENLIRSSNFIANIEYINERAEFFNTFTMGHFPWRLLLKTKKSAWMTMPSGNLRGFMLVRLKLKSGKIMYVFDLERKSHGEAFNGIVFSNNASLEVETITKLLETIALNRGTLRKRTDIGKMKDISLPVAKYQIFTHKPIEGSMSKKMIRVLTSFAERL